MREDFFIDYGNLSDFQRQIIDRKIDRPMVVTGCAGTGKSLIALHKAKKIDDSDHSYAIIVFTKTLKKYFSDGFNSLGLNENNIYYFNEWEKMWNKSKKKPKVQYLIVDEIQDFSPGEITKMKLYGNNYFFFGDTDQSIMSSFKKTQTVESTAKDMNVEPDKLRLNYRLPKETALVAEKVGEVEPFADRCQRNGEKPKLLSRDSFDAQLNEIIRIVENKKLTNVGILMPHNTLKMAKSHTGIPELSVEYVHQYLDNKGKPNEFKYDADEETVMDLDFHSSNIKIMTWWCAKGLQFKDVFIPGCCINEIDKRNALYVAITRCCERLYILHSGDLSSFFDQIPPNYWDIR